jgi:glycogen debranching enzyme
MTKLDIPDKTIEEAFLWIKYNYDQLWRKIPGIGDGLGAGMPAYPWWFGCDSNYAVLGLLPIGEFELAKVTLLTLAHYADHGRIPHEIVTNGYICNDYI